MPRMGLWKMRRTYEAELDAVFYAIMNRTIVSRSTVREILPRRLGIDQTITEPFSCPVSVAHGILHEIAAMS